MVQKHAVDLISKMRSSSQNDANSLHFHKTREEQDCQIGKSISPWCMLWRAQWIAVLILFDNWRAAKTDAVLVLHLLQLGLRLVRVQTLVRLQIYLSFCKPRRRSAQNTNLVGLIVEHD